MFGMLELLAISEAEAIRKKAEKEAHPFLNKVCTVETEKGERFFGKILSINGKEITLKEKENIIFISDCYKIDQNFNDNTL